MNRVNRSFLDQLSFHSPIVQLTCRAFSLRRLQSFSWPLVAALSDTFIPNFAIRARFEIDSTSQIIDILIRVLFEFICVCGSTTGAPPVDSEDVHVQELIDSKTSRCKSSAFVGIMNADEDSWAAAEISF